MLTSTFTPLPPPSLGPIYIDSDGPDESTRSQDSNHAADSDFGLDDEIRTMLINDRQKTEKAENGMTLRYNSSSVRTFNIGDLVSRYVLMISIANRQHQQLFCKLIRKPQPDMHERILGHHSHG